MTEYYPVIEDGRLVGVIATGGNALLLQRRDKHYYMWLTPSRAIEVTSLLVHGRLPVENDRIPIASWVYGPPYVHARTVTDLSEYARWLARRVGSQVRGRQVVVGVSGGKDSVAALLVLLELREYVEFRLRPMYIHIPLLDTERTLDFIDKVSSRLGIEIEVVEAPRRHLKSMLKWKGLPRRGLRWCTYYKVKPMRLVRKEDRRSLEVVADRAYEAPKRLRKLVHAARAQAVLVGRKFRPTYTMTLPDVVEIVRRTGLVHPDYLEGMPRVACSMCPYKSLYEFRSLNELEDPGFIEEVLRKEWKKWYSEIEWEKFLEMHLWRFPRRQALAVYRARLLLEEKRGELGEVRRESVVEVYRRVWEEGIPAPRASNPWMLVERAYAEMRKRRAIVLVD